MVQIMDMHTCAQPVLQLKREVFGYGSKNTWKSAAVHFCMHMYALLHHALLHSGICMCTIFNMQKCNNIHTCVQKRTLKWWWWDFLCPDNSWAKIHFWPCIFSSHTLLLLCTFASCKATPNAHIFFKVWNLNTHGDRSYYGRGIHVRTKPSHGDVYLRSMRQKFIIQVFMSSGTAIYVLWDEYSCKYYGTDI